MLSHGNAEVERGVSFGKNLLQENRTEKMLVSQSLIHQKIRKKNSFLEIEITQKMIHSVRLSSQRRTNYVKMLKDNASEEKTEKENAKRKFNKMRDLHGRNEKKCAEKDSALQLIIRQILELESKK